MIEEGEWSRTGNVADLVHKRDRLESDAQAMDNEYIR